MTTVDVDALTPAATEPPPRALWQLWAARLAPSLIWLVTSCVCYSKFLAHPSRSVPGGADGILYVWYFESVQHSVFHLHNPLFSDALNAPTGINVMWNTALLAVSFVVSPLTATIGAVATVGLMMLLAPVLSATSAYLVLRNVTGRDLASAVAATFYGFGPFFIGQAGHLHLIFAAPALPLIFLLGYQLFVRQSPSPRRVGIQLGVVVSVTMLVSEEIVAIAAITATIATIAASLINADVVQQRIRRSSTGLIWTTLTTLVLLCVPLSYQFYGPLALTEGIPGLQSLDVAGLIRPSRLQRFGSARDYALNATFPANQVENTGYLGWPLLILLLALLILMLVRRRRFALWWLITLLASVALSFGAVVYVNGQQSATNGPWEFLRRLPIVESLVAVRFTLTTTFLVSVGIAFGLATIRVRRHHLAACAVAAGVLLSFIPAQRYDDMLDLQSSRFFSSDAVNMIPSGAQTLILPLRSDPNSAAQVMYWQVQSNLRFDLVGGYSVFSHDGIPQYLTDLPRYAAVLQEVADRGQVPAETEASLARASVAATGVRYIVLTSLLHNRELVAQVASAVTGCAPRIVADVVLCAVSLG